jgi:thiamine pyrophosphokinase
LIFDYLVIAGGKAPNSAYIRKLLKISKNIITVDRGARAALKLKIKPLLHVGDGDSFSASEVKKLKPKSIISLDKMKEFSDLEFALRQLDESKTKLVIGAHLDFENRPDHGFLNLLLLVTSKNIIFADENNWITALTPMSRFSFSPPKGTPFSIAPLKMSKIWITGSGYDVKGEPFMYYTQGLSNFSKQKQISVKSQRSALIFVSSDITKTKIDGSVLAR